MEQQNWFHFFKLPLIEAYIYHNKQEGFFKENLIDKKMVSYNEFSTCPGFHLSNVCNNIPE